VQRLPLLLGRCRDRDRRVPPVDLVASEVDALFDEAVVHVHLAYPLAAGVIGKVRILAGADGFEGVFEPVGVVPLHDLEVRHARHRSMRTSVVGPVRLVAVNVAEGPDRIARR
jgi:hypothetical protein